MSKGKFAVHRTSTLTGKPVFYFAATLAMTAGALLPLQAQAQSASDVYKKMSDVYAYAKSFQGTIMRSESGKANGQAATQNVTVKVSFKAPNKYLLDKKQTVVVGGKSQSASQIMVTDGKALYMYVPDKKIYQRGQVQNANMLTQFFALLKPENGFMMLPETTVNGHAAYALQPNVPTKGPAEQIANAKKVKIVILIDKKNYQFLKMTIVGPTGSLSQTVSGQVVNGNVADSLFNWTPPAAYKEIKPQPTGGGPTIPGAGTPGAPR